MPGARRIEREQQRPAPRAVHEHRLAAALAHDQPGRLERAHVVGDAAGHDLEPRRELADRRGPVQRPQQRRPRRSEQCLQ
jgi:hypothetical protein